MPTEKTRSDWMKLFGSQVAHICAWIARRDAAGHSHRQTLQVASARFHGRKLGSHPGKRLKLKVNTLYRLFRRYQAGGASAIIPQYKAPGRPQEEQSHATPPITLRYNGNGRRMSKGLLRILFIQGLFLGNVMSLQEAVSGAIALSGQRLKPKTCYGMLEPEQRNRLRKMYADRKKAASEEGKLLRDITACSLGICHYISPPLPNAPGRAAVAGGIQPSPRASDQSAIVLQ